MAELNTTLIAKINHLQPNVLFNLFVQQPLCYVVVFVLIRVVEQYFSDGIEMFRFFRIYGLRVPLFGTLTI